MASDTCGSIRIPAANNNLFGLRGTLGLSSRTGIIPLSHTQDIGGLLARTVADPLLLDATAQTRDPHHGGSPRLAAEDLPKARSRRIEGRAHRRAGRISARRPKTKGVGYRAPGPGPDEGPGRRDRRGHHPRTGRRSRRVEPDQPEFKTDLIHYLAQSPTPP
jgi:hypothetical protein